MAFNTKSRLRANQSVDPALVLPSWYPAQLLGYSTQMLTARFDTLRHLPQRDPPSIDQPFQLLECFVKAAQVTEYLTAKRAAKRKWVSEDSGKGLQKSSHRELGVQHHHNLRSEHLRTA